MRIFARPVRSDWIGGLAVFLAAFGVYCATLSRTVGFVDSGELALVSHTLGIAHPTGYPLYTLFSHLFTFIPFFEPLVRINLFSALAASAAAAGFFLS
jgi:hypothetical protein